LPDFWATRLTSKPQNFLRMRTGFNFFHFFIYTNNVKGIFNSVAQGPRLFLDPSRFRFQKIVIFKALEAGANQYLYSFSTPPILKFA
jgi:hypothetical protein